MYTLYQRQENLHSHQMVIERRQRVFGHLKCDLCNYHKGTEWHHIYSKGVVQTNEEARLISNRPELGTLLCHNCHQYEIYDQKSMDWLYQVLYQLWSYDGVRYYHDKLSRVMIGGEPWRIPDFDNDFVKRKRIIEDKLWNVIIHTEDEILHSDVHWHKPEVHYNHQIIMIEHHDPAEAYKQQLVHDEIVRRFNAEKRD